MLTTLNIRSIGHICGETGIPFEIVRRIVKAHGILPAIIDNGCPKFDDDAFEQIVTAHATLAAADTGTKLPPSKPSTPGA